MRTLKYAILGLLCKGPLTGYDIAREFDKGLGYFWSANHSQIYPELKKLTDEGLVRFDVVIQGEKLEKKLYTITAEGKLDFEQWLLRDEPLEPTPKDVFRLRVYLSGAMEDAQLLQSLYAQHERRLGKLSLLEQLMEQLMEQQFSTSPPKHSSPWERGDYLVLHGAILREKAYVQWIDDCIALMEKQEG